MHTTFGWRSRPPTQAAHNRRRALAHDDRLVQVTGQGGRVHSGAPGGPSGPVAPELIGSMLPAAAVCGLRSSGPARLNGSFERAVSGLIELIARS
jgi:hypothetical protein